MYNWLSIVAGIAYATMGVYILIYKFLGIVLEPATAYALGGLFIIYGIFRIVRAILKIRNERKDI